MLFNYLSAIIFEPNDTLPKLKIHFHFDIIKKSLAFAPTPILDTSSRHFEKVFGQVKVPWAATLDTIH